MKSPLAPVLLEHRGFPLVGGVEDVILRAAHLGPLQAAGDVEAEFPSELMAEQLADSLERSATAGFVEAEHVAQVGGVAVPKCALEGLHGGGV